MSTSTVASSGSNSASAGAAVQAPVQKTTLVAGEERNSVNVQSQLATSTVAGDVTSKSNLGQVVTDLGAAHAAHSGWVESESAKISAWGQAEIARILAQTKGMEQQLIKGAQDRQKALDESHSGELAKLVQQMDLRKAAELKELEDALQRQIQGVLTASKNDINRIESEMNTRKMELLKQSQLKSASEIDQLSNLVVQTKLVPSQTRTVIETNTETGNLVAVATGGSISTGSAEASVVASQQIAAVPNAGRLTQETDVRTGDMVQTNTNRKVGEGAIVNTMTEVVEQGAGRTEAASASNRGGNIATASSATATSGSDGISKTSSTKTDLSKDRDLHHGATQVPGEAVPVDAGRQAGMQGRPAFHHDGEKSQYNADGTQNKDWKASDSTIHPEDRYNPDGTERKDWKGHSQRPADAAYGKHQESSSGSQGGLMNKVRNALHVGSEPKSNEATKRV